MNNKTEFGVSEIEIGDMLKSIARKWKVILVFIFVGMLIVPALKYGIDKKNAIAAAQLAASIETTQTGNIADKLSDEEKKAVDYVRDYESLIKQREDYLSESVLMKINPMAENVVVLQYMIVDTEVEGKENNIVSESVYDLCVNYINNGGLALDLTEENKNIKREELDELVSAASLISGSSSFTIKIKCVDEEMTESIAEKVQNCIKKYQNKINEIYPKINIRLVTQYDSVISDESLYNNQITNRNQLKSMQDTLATLKQNLSESQKLYLDSYGKEVIETSDVQGTEQRDLQPMPEIKIDKKMIVLGAIIGAVLAIFWLASIYVLGNKIKSGKDIYSMYGVKTIGEVKNGDNADKEYISSRLLDICKRRGIDSLVYVTLFFEKKREKAFIEDVWNDLKENKIEIGEVQEISYGKNDLNNAIKAGNIVYIGKVGKTGYAELEKMMLLTNEHEINNMGMILFC